MKSAAMKTSANFTESAQNQKPQSSTELLEKADHLRLRAAASLNQNIGLYDDARMAYLEAVKADPGNTAALYSAAMEYLRMAEFIKAGKLINAVLKINENHNQDPNPYTLVAHAACLKYARHGDDANTIFSQVESIPGMGEVIISLKKSAKAARYMVEDVAARRCPAHILTMMDKNFRKSEIPNGQLQAKLKNWQGAQEEPDCQR